jgi:hypothetical protein
VPTATTTTTTTAAAAAAATTTVTVTRCVGKVNVATRARHDLFYLFASLANYRKVKLLWNIHLGSHVTVCGRMSACASKQANSDRR